MPLDGVKSTKTGILTIERKNKKSNPAIFTKIGLAKKLDFLYNGHSGQLYQSLPTSKRTSPSNPPWANMPIKNIVPDMGKKFKWKF